jgi:glutamate dehydrogenase
MIMDTGRIIQRGTMWFLRHREWLADLEATLAHFSPGVGRLAADLHDLVTPAYREELDQIAANYAEKGVPPTLAQRMASLDELYSALDLVEIAVDTGKPEAMVAKVYFALGGQLELHWLGRQIAALPAETRWQSLARSALRVDLSSQARTLACDALKLAPKAKDVDAILTAWNETVSFPYRPLQPSPGRCQDRGQHRDAHVVGVDARAAQHRLKSGRERQRRGDDDER